MSKLYIYKKIEIIYILNYYQQMPYNRNKGYWRGKSYRDYENCYKGHEENEANSVFVLHRGKWIFANEFAYISGNRPHVEDGLEVNEESLYQARFHGCL